MAKNTKHKKNTRRKGGMIKTFAKPIGRAALVIGEEYSKDYLQKKIPKIVQYSLDDPSLIKKPEYLLMARKKIPNPSIKIKQYYNPDNSYDKENMNTNLLQGGKSKRNDKKRQSRKTRRALYK